MGPYPTHLIDDKYPTLLCYMVTAISSQGEILQLANDCIESLIALQVYVRVCVWCNSIACTNAYCEVFRQKLYLQYTAY